MRKLFWITLLLFTFLFPPTLGMVDSILGFHHPNYSPLRVWTFLKTKVPRSLFGAAAQFYPGVAFAWNPLLQTTSSGETCPDCLFWWRCEAADFSSTNGTDDYSAGDDTVSLNNATIDTCGKTNNGLCGGGVSYYGEVTTSNGDIFDGSSGAIGFWHYTPSYNTYGRYWRWYGDSSNSIYIRDSGSDLNDLEVQWKGNGETDVWTVTDSDMATSTWYFITLQYDCSQSAGSDIVELHVYESDGSEKGSGYSTSSATCSVIDTTVNSGSNTVRMGNSDSNDGKDVDLDNIMHSNDPTRDFKDFMDTDSYPGS